MHTQSVYSSLHSLNAGIPCLQDDERLVELGKSESSLDPEFEATHCQRILFVWRVIFHLCKANHGLALRTWVQLLDGEVGKDIWLWADGDEIHIPTFYTLARDSPTAQRKRRSPVSGWRLTSADLHLGILALKRRLERVRQGATTESLDTTERRKRVRFVEPGVRFAAIAWSIATSEAMGYANASRGVQRPDFERLCGLLESVVEFPRSTQSFIKSTISSDYWQRHGVCYDRIFSFDFGERDECSSSRWIYVASLVTSSQESDATSFKIFCPGNRCTDR